MSKSLEQFGSEDNKEGISGRLPIPEATSKEEKEKIVILKFPLQLGFMTAPAVVDKIEEFTKQGNVELSYGAQKGIKNILNAVYNFELKGRREDIDNVVKGINSIIEASGR